MGRRRRLCFCCCLVRGHGFLFGAIEPRHTLALAKAPFELRIPAFYPVVGLGNLHCDSSCMSACNNASPCTAWRWYYRSRPRDLIHYDIRLFLLICSIHSPSLSRDLRSKYGNGTYWRMRFYEAKRASGPQSLEDRERTVSLQMLFILSGEVLECTVSFSLRDILCSHRLVTCI